MVAGIEQFMITSRRHSTSSGSYPIADRLEWNCTNVNTKAQLFWRVVTSTVWVFLRTKKMFQWHFDRCAIILMLCTKTTTTTTCNALHAGPRPRACFRFGGPSLQLQGKLNVMLNRTERESRQHPASSTYDNFWLQHHPNHRNHQLTKIICISLTVQIRKKVVTSAHH